MATSRLSKLQKITCGIAIAFICNAAWAAEAQSPKQCESIARIDLAGLPDAPTSITKVEQVSPRQNATSAYCQVQGYIHPNVGFVIRLPVVGWNEKFLQLGCGGFCGSAQISGCDDPLRRGYACIVSDNGHTGAGMEAVWAYNNWPAEIDHAFRGAHVTALAGKAIVERYYGRAPRYSYYWGGSTGGRLALLEAQRFPWDFDGIIAGVPSLPVPLLHVGLLWGHRALHAGGQVPILEQSDLDLLHEAVVQRCDMNDGVKDGLIGDPRHCTFDPAILRCAAGKTGACLTSAQLRAIDQIYGGPVTSRGEQIYFAGALKGSERSWLDWFGRMFSSNPQRIYHFVQDNFRYAAFDPDPGPTWKPEDFDFDRDYKRLGVAESLYSAGNPDLRRFKGAGGKLIVYHGWNDAGGMPLPTIDYYEMVERVFGAREATQEFFRLFLVPGMNHGPNEVDGLFETDWLAYLEDWVEEGKAPGPVINHHVKFAQGREWPPRLPLDAARIEFSRPIYPYPQLTRYSGRGDPSQAANFEPVEPARAVEVAEATVSDLQLGMTQGKFTSQDLVRAYLARIERYEPLLNAAIAVNPNALAEADALDRERKAGRVRGPLHGVPIALKDNILANGMPTTGGALAFAGYVAPYEATLTTKLRQAGAVIIAKTNLTELASWVGLGMPGGYSAVAGYSLNPYDPRPDPSATDGRPALSPAGSSSGIGTAASLWAASVGTETSGSILSPSGATMLAAIKPTLGRISRHGVIPLTADQDTAGPMARTVTDAALLLGAMEGWDRNDSATAACRDEPGHDYRRHLKLDGLKGARIGIPRAFFFDPVTPPGETAPAGGLSSAQAALVAEAIVVLKAQGATIVDPADIPSVLDPDPERNFVRWNAICLGPKSAGDRDCSTVLKYGFKRDFNAFLKTLGAGAPVKSLTELRAFNVANAARGSMRHSQSQLDNSDEIDVIADRARYEADRKRDLYLSRVHGLDEAIKTHRLDAVLMPAGGGTGGIGARAGYPTVQVPIGFTPADAHPPFPQGFDAKPQPYGIGFTGLACTEGRLIELAYAFEQATRRRVPPAATP